MLMKSIVVIVLITFTVSSIFGYRAPILAQQNRNSKYSLGVLPFRHAGVEEYEAISLSNRLHSELVKTKKFRVVEIERIKDVLDEMGFQMTGTCNDEECVIQVGNMLGAKFMVTGSIGKVGRTYTVDVRIIKVENRRVIYARTGNTKGRIDELLELMREIALEVAGLNGQDKEKGLKWLWILGSTVIIGGGIAAYLFTQQPKETKPVQVIGTPPDPPRNP